MKNSHVALLTMVAAVFQFSCEESVEPKMTAQEIEQKVLDKIEKNEGISYDLFRLLGEGVDAETINRLKASSLTKEEFINSMADASDDYFEEVVEMNIADYQIQTIPVPFKNVELQMRKIAGLEPENALPYWDWLLDYSSLILAEIEKQSAGGRKEWIILNSFDDGKGVNPLASESVAFSYSKIKMMASEIHKVYMNMSLTDEQVLVTINEMMISHGIPSTAVALLVPAVQKVREAAAANSEPFGDALKVYLDETVGQAINGSLDRDIIRRIQAASFLAGLHTIILPEYDNANQDLASLSIMHARYRAAIAGASGGIWKTTN